MHVTPIARTAQAMSWRRGVNGLCEKLMSKLDQLGSGRTSSILHTQLTQRRCPSDTPPRSAPQPPQPPRSAAQAHAFVTPSATADDGSATMAVGRLHAIFEARLAEIETRSSEIEARSSEIVQAQARRAIHEAELARDQVVPPPPSVPATWDPRHLGSPPPGISGASAPPHACAAPRVPPTHSQAILPLRPPACTGCIDGRRRAAGVPSRPLRPRAVAAAVDGVAAAAAHRTAGIAPRTAAAPHACARAAPASHAMCRLVPAEGDPSSAPCRRGGGREAGSRRAEKAVARPPLTTRTARGCALRSAPHDDAGRGAGNARRRHRSQPALPGCTSRGAAISTGAVGGGGHCHACTPSAGEVGAQSREAPGAGGGSARPTKVWGREMRAIGP